MKKKKEKMGKRGMVGIEGEKKDGRTYHCWMRRQQHRRLMLHARLPLCS